MVVRALRYAARTSYGAERMLQLCTTMLERHAAYVREHLEDLPAVRNWVWRAAA